MANRHSILFAEWSARGYFRDQHSICSGIDKGHRQHRHQLRAGAIRDRRALRVSAPLAWTAGAVDIGRETETNMNRYTLLAYLYIVIIGAELAIGVGVISILAYLFLRIGYG